MSRTTIGLVMTAMALCFTAVTSTAQTTTASTQVKQFEVIAVSGNDLVVNLPEGTREINVPADFRFTVNGQQLATRDLKPGMKGTATITTTTTVTPVVVTEVKNGEVVQASATTLLVRTEQGFRQFTEADLKKRNITIVRNGAPAKFTDFSTGDRLSASIVTTLPPRVMTQQQVDATLAQAPPAAVAAAAPAAPRPTPAATPATTLASAAPAPRELPKTGSAWPLLALASILSIAMGLTLTVRRRLVR
jgi:LPXTG-motif cell wall-anchored protein